MAFGGIFYWGELAGLYFSTEDFYFFEINSLKENFETFLQAGGRAQYKILPGAPEIPDPGS